MTSGVRVLDLVTTYVCKKPVRANQRASPWPSIWNFVPFLHKASGQNPLVEKKASSLSSSGRSKFPFNSRKRYVLYQFAISLLLSTQRESDVRLPSTATRHPPPCSRGNVLSYSKSDDTIQLEVRSDK